MFEICSEFAMISMGGAIERQLCPLLNLIQCALSIAPPIKIIAYSVAYFYEAFTIFTIFCFLQYFTIMIPTQVSVFHKFD